MKTLMYLVITLSLLSKTAYGQEEKVTIDFVQDEVYVLLDDNYIEISPKTIKINFDLNRALFFYKKGYYSQRVVIDSDSPFKSLNIDLTPTSKNIKLPYKQLLKPDTLVVSKIVTNFTRNDIIEALGNNFIKNNFVIGKENDLFKYANSDIKDTKYKIAAEIVESDQKRSVYKSPRYLMAQITIRWSLLDVELNKVVYFNETEGSHLTSMDKSTGYVVSDLMKRTMLEAIEEAQEKLMTDKKFLDIILKNTSPN